MNQIDWEAVGARSVKQFEQSIADAICAKSERERGGIASVLADPDNAFRAMRNTQQRLAMYEREP